MSMYTSDVNRVTGLSGIDTESMIDKMMKAESAKYEKMQKEEQTLTWQQEAYREIITSLQDFQNKWFGTNKQNNLGYSAAWNNFKMAVKDKTGKESDAITIKSSSCEGKYEVEVTQVAQTESLTGKAVINNELVTGTTASEIAATIDKLGKDEALSLKFDLDGTTQEIKITKDDLTNAAGSTPGEKLTNVFNEKLKKAFGTTLVNGKQENKVSAILENGKLKFSTVSGSTLSIVEGSDFTSGTSLEHEGILAKDKEGKFKLEVTVDGKKYTVETEFKADDSQDTRISNIVNAFKNAKDDTGNTVDISKDLSLSISKDGDNLKISNLSNKDNYEITTTFTPSDGSQATTKTATLNNKSNLDKLGFTSGVSTTVTEQNSLTQVLGEEFTKLFDSSAGLVNADGAIEFQLGDKTVTVSKDDTIESLINKINVDGTGVKLSFNQVTGRFKLDSVQSGANGQISISDGTHNTNAQKLFNVLGIDVVDKANNDRHVKGQDAEFTIDGIKVTRPSNEVNLNGLQFTINGVTNGEVTIEAATDEEATFNKIKEFVEDYNKLITSIESKVNENREKSSQYGYYEPLLPDEKDAMSEDEIKKWEEKAKKGILYKDEILTGILSDLRGIVYQPIDLGGGKKLSLYEIGITTTSDFNSGKLQIDESKLKEAISERGDDIAKMFTTTGGVAEKIKKVLDNSVGTNGRLRQKAGIKDTASVANNDISNQMKELAKRMATEKQRLYDKEMQYFKMFAQMETMMNKQNSQMNMVMSMMGV